MLIEKWASVEKASREAKRRVSLPPREHIPEFNHLRQVASHSVISEIPKDHAPAAPPPAMQYRLPTRRRRSSVQEPKPYQSPQQEPKPYQSPQQEPKPYQSPQQEPKPYQSTPQESKPYQSPEHEPKPYQSTPQEPLSMHEVDEYHPSSVIRNSIQWGPYPDSKQDLAGLDPFADIEQYVTDLGLSVTDSGQFVTGSGHHIEDLDQYFVDLAQYGMGPSLYVSESGRYITDSGQYVTDSGHFVADSVQRSADSKKSVRSPVESDHLPPLGKAEKGRKIVRGDPGQRVVSGIVLAVRSD